jgi:hypothetical protein
MSDGGGEREKEKERGRVDRRRVGDKFDCGPGMWQAGIAKYLFIHSWSTV